MASGDITYGTGYELTVDTTLDFPIFEKLDDTHFVFAYLDPADSYYLYTVIGVVSSTTIIAFGTPVRVQTEISDFNSISRLTDTSFFVSFQGTTDHGTGRVASVASGDIISFGSPVVFNSAATAKIYCSPLDSTHVAISYRDDGNSSYGTSIIANISGTTISSYGSEYVFLSDVPDFINVESLDSTHFVVAYDDSGESPSGQAIIGVVSSGDTISFGLSKSYGSTNTDYIWIAKLDSAKFAVGFSDVLIGDGIIVIGDVTSGDVITFGSNQVYDTDVTHHNRVVALDSTHIVVYYRDDGSGSLMTARYGTVTGTSVSYDTTSSITNSANASGITALTDSTFVVSYQDSTDSYYSFEIIGEVETVTIFTMTMSGGGTGSGDAVETPAYNESMSGGGTGSGEAGFSSSNIYSMTMSGGGSGSGSAGFNQEQSMTMSGGGSGSGSAGFAQTMSMTMSGGGVGSGAAGFESHQLYSMTMSGGGSGSGSAGFSQAVLMTMSGGGVGSGAAGFESHQLYSMTMSGGGVGSGSAGFESHQLYSMTMSGGGAGSGSAFPEAVDTIEQIIFEKVAGTGDIIIAVGTNSFFIRTTGDHVEAPYIVVMPISNNLFKTTQADNPNRSGKIRLSFSCYNSSQTGALALAYKVIDAAHNIVITRGTTHVYYSESANLVPIDFDGRIFRYVTDIIFNYYTL